MQAWAALFGFARRWVQRLKLREEGVYDASKPDILLAVEATAARRLVFEMNKYRCIKLLDPGSSMHSV
jgi:hypothetical protein